MNSKEALVHVVLGLWLGFNAISAAGKTANDPLSDDPGTDARYPAGITELAIDYKGAKMPGHIYQAQGEGPHPTVVLLHGLPGNEKNLDIAQTLRRAGFNVLFFHYRGAWGAQGSYAMSQVDDDVLAVLRFLRQPQTARALRVDPRRLSLLGHSLGGFAALAAGSQDDALVCVAALSPANLGVWKQAQQAGNTAALQWLVDYADSLFMLNGFDGKAMLADMAATPMAELDTTGFGGGLRSKSVLLIVGDEDTVTPPETMFDPVVTAYGKDPKIELRHHTISGDHSFSWSRLALTRLVLEWLQANCR